MDWLFRHFRASQSRGSHREPELPTPASDSGDRSHLTSLPNAAQPRGSQSESIRRRQGAHRTSTEIDSGYSGPATEIRTSHELVHGTSPAIVAPTDQEKTQLHSPDSHVVSKPSNDAYFPTTSPFHGDMQSPGSLDAVDDASKVRAWAEYRHLQAEVMDSRIRSRQFRVAYSQKRLALQEQANKVYEHLQPALDVNDEESISALKKEIASLQHIIQEVGVAATELDKSERQLINEEYSLETIAPVAMDSSPTMPQWLQSHGFDFPVKASGYAPSSATSRTHSDMEPGPEDAALREKLAKINSLETRLLQIQLGQGPSPTPYSSRDSTQQTSTLNPVLSSEEHAGYNKLMQELNEAREEFDALRPNLPLDETLSMQENPDSEDILLNMETQDAISTTDFSVRRSFLPTGLSEPLSLDDLLNEAIEPFPDINFHEEDENTKRKELVDSWLFKGVRDGPAADEKTSKTGLVSARSDPLPDSQNHHGLQPSTEQSFRSDKPYPEYLGDTQSVPLGNDQTRPILLAQRSRDAQPP